LMENWRTVLGNPGYEVSDLGRVKSVRSGGLLRPQHAKGPSGKTIRLRVTLAGDRVPRSLHDLVLTAFVGPRPAGMQGCHWDGDPTNNTLPNLRWDTAKSNRADSSRHGTEPHGEKHHAATINAVDAERIRDLLNCELSVLAIAGWLGCSRGAARGVAEGRTWRQRL
jgi:hypothetical protein